MSNRWLPGLLRLLVAKAKDAPGPPQQYLALCGSQWGGLIIPLLTASEMFYLRKERVLSASVPINFPISRNVRKLGYACVFGSNSGALAISPFVYFHG